MPGVSRRGVFLSYRRDDAGPYARSLQLQLSQRVPDALVFMDLDSIEPGLDFAEVIEEAVNSCAVLVALIGRQWATVTDEDGARRLDNPDDYVRFEVKTALERGVRVIPVLIDGARALRQQDLPAELHKLARLNATKLSYDRYQDDADRLLDLIQRVLAAVGEEPGTERERELPARNAENSADRQAQEEATHQAEEADAKVLGERANAVEALTVPHGGRSDGNAGGETARKDPEAIQDDRAPAGAGRRNPKSDGPAPRPGNKTPASRRRAVPGLPTAPPIPQTWTATLGRSPTHSVAFSPDGRLLASGSQDEKVRLWDPATRKRIRILSGHLGHVWSVAFSPDGRLLASGGEGMVRLWDPATGQHLRTLTDRQDSTFQVTFSPDGRLLASGSRDKTVRLWNPATGKLLRTITGHTDVVLRVAFSPDGRLLASGSRDKTVRLWNPATGKLLRTLTGHKDIILSVAFSPDGRLLASGGHDKEVQLWDPATGKLRRTLTGHTKDVYSVAFSPDGRLLASGSLDKTVRLWNPATGQHLHTLTSPGGHRLVGGVQPGRAAARQRRERYDRAVALTSCVARAFWLQTNGAPLFTVKSCSPERVRMAAQNGYSARVAVRHCCASFTRQSARPQLETNVLRLDLSRRA